MKLLVVPEARVLPIPPLTALDLPLEGFPPATTSLTSLCVILQWVSSLGFTACFQRDWLITGQCLVAQVHEQRKQFACCLCVSTLSLGATRQLFCWLNFGFQVSET